ncbi:hypothetical protein JTE90_020479, partial [Oedothorax gibbosus]
GFVKPQEDNNRKNQITDKDSSVSNPIRSHPKPQLETAKNKPPGRLEAFLQSYKEYPRIPLQALNSGSAVKNTSNAFTSKIPKVSKTQATQRETEIPKPVEASIDIANHRRETFVVLKPCDHVPEVFATAEDRRGTFVISKPSEVSKFQNDRRETYVVPPVSPVHEKLIPESNLVDLVQDNNFDEPVPPAEKDIPNRTILLCEDMELTGVIPTGKVWTHEGVEMAQPCEEMKTVLPETSKDVECRDVISKMPIVNSPLKDTNVTKEHAVLERNVSSKKSTTSTKGLNGQDCFVKPCMSQNNPPMPVLSNTVSPEIVSSEDAKKSRKSAVKRKKSHDLEPPEKPKKGRASSTSKRKSVAPKAASDVSSKGAHRKSIQRTSSRKSVIPKDPEVDFCSDLEDEIFSNISISSSPSPHRRETRDKKSINFEKYFMDASYEAVPPEAKKEVPLGRRVIDFFETRESLVPNKRNFVFTSKKTNTESASTAQESASNSKAIELTMQEMDERVFEFTASDSEDGNRKPKKSKKRSKKVDLTSQSQKESKKPHLEEVSHPQTEKLHEIVAEHKNKTASKKSESVSTNLKKKSFASTSSETSDYSFVIGDKVDETNKVHELVNSKGERIVLESFKPNQKTERKLSTGECKAKPSENSQKGNSNNCQYVLVHSPPIVQDNKKSLSPDIDLPGTSSEDSGKNSCESQSSRSSKVTERRSSRSSKISEGFPPRSSKVSGGRGRVKRTFSGVSDRRSKKKSTLDPSDFLDEFNSPITLEEAPPKSMQFNSSPLGLDSEMTEVYNLKDIIQAKAQEEKSKHQEKISAEKHAQPQLKAQEDKLLQLNMVPDSKLTQNQTKVREDTSKHQEQVPSKMSTQQKTVQSEELKDRELSGENLIQQKGYVQEDKTRKNKEISGVKLIEQTAKLQVDKSKHQEMVSDAKLVQQKATVQKDKIKSKEVSAEKLIQPKANVQEDKLNNNIAVSGEKLIQQRAKVQERVPEEEFKNEESKAIIQNSNTLKSKNGSSEIRITSVTCSKSNETAKEYNNEKAFSDKESKSVEHSVKILVSNTETLTLPLGTNNNKLTHAKHEQVIDIKKGKDVEPPVSKEHISSKKDVLSDTVASSLLIEKHHKSSKEFNSNKVTSVLEKQKDSANNLKVTQNVKSKNRRDHEEPSVPCSSTDKNNAVLQNTAAKFNRADFNAMNLDDLTSNDFVPVKTKKLFKESQNKMDVATLKEKQSKSKRPRMGKPNSKENKAAKVKVSVETDLNSTASKGEHNLEEVFNHANSTDAIPIHRQNCSGSIGSLCNADSKENEGRPSRRNRGTKSYKEPPLNVKMRR